MKNIHIISTDKSSRLAILGMSNTLQLFDKPITFKNFGRSPQNIYITNSEEIKEGDWLISKEGNLHNNFGWNYGDRKIILTDNKDLIADGVQAIDDEFLEWFVKNPSCEEVEVYDVNGKLFAEPIIPKEETKQYSKYLSCCRSEEECYCKEELKRETLEDVAENFWLNDNSMSDNDKIAYVNGFLTCAKWQQERSYSEIEVLQLLLRLQQTESYNNLYEWFEQNKKK